MHSFQGTSMTSAEFTSGDVCDGMTAKFDNLITLAKQQHNMSAEEIAEVVCEPEVQVPRG